VPVTDERVGRRVLVEAVDAGKAKETLGVGLGLASEPGDRWQAAADQGERKLALGDAVKGRDQGFEAAWSRNWISSNRETTPERASWAAWPSSTSRWMRSSSRSPESARPVTASTSIESSKPSGVLIVTAFRTPGRAGRGP